MTASEKVRNELRRNGFVRITEYDDPAGEEYPSHIHPGDHVLAVLEGSVSVHMNGETKSLSAGDSIIFPQKVPHSVTIGENGAVYLEGEKSLV